MSEITLEQWIKIIIAISALLVPIIGSFVLQIRKRAQQDMKIKNIEIKHEDFKTTLADDLLHIETGQKELKSEIEKDMNAMEIRHTLAVQRIEASIAGINKKNTVQHGTLFQGQSKTNEALKDLSSEVHGLIVFLKGKDAI